MVTYHCIYISESVFSDFKEVANLGKIKPKQKFPRYMVYSCALSPSKKVGHIYLLICWSVGVLDFKNFCTDTAVYKWSPFPNKLVVKVKIIFWTCGHYDVILNVFTDTSCCLISLDFLK